MNTNLAEVQTVNNIGLPVDPDTFSKFILDFLGHKENLSYKSTDNFLINLEDIAQFNHLIKSKLSYQKNVYLEHFSINFGYTDGTFRKIQGEQSLINFLETRTVNINSVNLNWKIIVKFDNNPTIETQEINLLFIKNFDNEIDKEKSNNHDEISLIDLTINHTNQSWALDILNAFKEKIAEVIIKPHKMSIFYNKIKNSPSVFLLLIIGFYVSTLYVFVPSNSDFDKELRRDLVQLTMSQEHKTELNKVISLLDITTHDFKDIKNLEKTAPETKNIISTHNKKTYISFACFGLIFIFPFIFLRFIKYSINYLNHKSFIIANKTSQKSLDNYRDEKNKITYFGATAIIASILISIVSATIFKLAERIIF